MGSYIHFSIKTTVLLLCIFFVFFWKMTLLCFTIVLATLLFATPIVDAGNCNGVKYCYKRIQKQENLELQQTIMTMNRKILSQDEKIQHLQNKFSKQRKKFYSLQTDKDEINI